MVNTPEPSAPVPPASAREPRPAIAQSPPRAESQQRAIARWLRQELVTAPLVPVLHTSPLRMKGLGLFTLFGHPIFWFVWAVWLPQPYENLGLRLFTASLGLLLISKRVSSDPGSVLAGRVFTAVFWFELPFLFSWMFFANGGNAVWMASMAAMILIYYFSTDWRLATVGIALGVVLARLLLEVFGPPLPPMAPDVVLVNLMVLAFCVSMGMLLGVSSANLRREQLDHTLTTMGIMAHELRTPLATMALIGDAVRGSAAQSDEPVRGRLEELAGRLHALVRNMHHQIDMQISNARLLRLPETRESMRAADLVAQTVAGYPFRSSRERDCVRVTVRRDFQFSGSQALFKQVLDNLIKNALRSLAAAGTGCQPGDLALEVDMEGDWGRIVVADRGVGVDAELQPRIFEPFFSTNRGTGHGLGLALCRRVVQAAGGTIRVRSEPGHGATFIIELPVRP